MRYSVFLTAGAERDIADLYDYVSAHDSVESAVRLLSGLNEAVLNLAELPLRGNVPKELASIGAAGFRELHHKPYRIFYRIRGNDVFVVAIADGRRDIQSFLRSRLVRLSR
ncbi:MAG TPA: type II toxin-antitoxin system RelE/ParE family toxin [Xanthobacteraceae bacterium]|nr:type II toxin-antitoxin system RelE/ParE family toxin [Xanthobacteraceae bacterium]